MRYLNRGGYVVVNKTDYVADMAILKERINCLEELTEGRLDVLEKWQIRQNGSLTRLADGLDKFQWWLIGILFSSLASLVAVLLATNKV
jgi:hypothetical protein